MAQCLPTLGPVPRGQKDLRHRESLIKSLKRITSRAKKKSSAKCFFLFNGKGGHQELFKEKDVGKKGKIANVCDFNIGSVLVILSEHRLTGVPIWDRLKANSCSI